MQFVLTTAGQAAIAATPGVPPVLTLYKLGDSFGYVPASTDLDIHGTQVGSGQPSIGIPQSNNLVKYTIFLDATIGDFQFGEVGLYLAGGVLFAIGSGSALINKLKNSGTQIGNNFVIDAYVTTVGTNYAIYAELGNSASSLNLSAVQSVDYLPSAFNAFPNIYLCPSPDANGGTVLAFSNNATWNITGYEEVIDTGVISASTATSISVGTTSIGPNYAGELVFQILDGPAAGATRIVSGYTTIGSIFSVGTPLAILPETNNTYRLLKKTMLRPHVAAMLAGLELALTAGHLNDLLDHPLDIMVKKDGSVAMQAPFNAGSHRVVNVGNPLLATDASNKAYVDSQLTASSALISAMSAALTTIQNQYFRRDGALAMTGNLNFGGLRGVNLAAPINPADAATKAFTESAIAAAVSSIITDHNDLVGLQGGNGTTEFYHLDNLQRAFLANLVLNSYPLASYGSTGDVQLANNAVTALGTSSTTAITPEALYLALSSATFNPMQSAVLDIVGNFSSVVQAGSGAPTVATPTTPALYIDVSTNPAPIYAYYSGAWRELATKNVRYGTGAPTGATPIVPVIYVDTSATNWVTYFYNAGVWKNTATPYIQYGSGSPTVVTNTDPAIYVDTSGAPKYKIWVSNGGAWFDTSSDTGVTSDDLYFFGQL